MPASEPASRRGILVARACIVTLQWVCLTLALTALVIYSSPELEGMVSPNIDGSNALIGALVCALLLGFTIKSPKVLFPLIALMCVTAASLFATLIMAPAWQGTVLHTTALRNFAINQVVIMTLLLSLPALIGGVTGHLMSGMLGSRGEILS